VTVLALPRLRPDQSRIVRHPAKVKVLAAGRRFGKTFMCGVIVVAAAAAGNRVAWVVPTYKNARPAWRWIEQHLAPLLGKDGPVRVNRSTLTAEFASFGGRAGGFIGVYSADNDVSIRGEAFHLIIVDEAARVSEQTWTDVLMPTLADFGGDAILISTPLGRNWFWREWERARSKMDRELAAFTAPTTDNPMPSIRRAAELVKDRVPERVYRQEWLAEFVDDGGGIFRHIREQATAEPQERALEGHRYAIGVDWGRFSDFTVLTVLDCTLRAVVWIDRFNQIDYTIQKGRLMALCERFKPDAVIAEQNSMGVPLVEDLIRMDLPVAPFQTTNASKAQAVDGLALAFERRALTIPPDETLITELQSYTAERLPSGLLRYSAPEGLHDDMVMSLMLVWFAVAGTQYAYEAF